MSKKKKSKPNPKHTWMKGYKAKHKAYTEMADHDAPIETRRSVYTISGGLCNNNR